MPLFTYFESSKKNHEKNYNNFYPIPNFVRKGVTDIVRDIRLVGFEDF